MVGMKLQKMKIEDPNRLMVCWVPLQEQRTTLVMAINSYNGFKEDFMFFDRIQFACYLEDFEKAVKLSKMQREGLAEIERSMKAFDDEGGSK